MTTRFSIFRRLALVTFFVFHGFAGHSATIILTIAFDEIFRQYREQAGTERLLTPLELGPAFNKQTGQSGQWIHYKTGLRDPESGKFGVQLWQQLYWTNNKGKFAIKLKGARAYAFKEDHIPNTSLELIIHRPNFRAGLQWG